MKPTYCQVCEQESVALPLCAVCASVPALAKAFAEGQARLLERESVE